MSKYSYSVGIQTDLVDRPASVYSSMASSGNGESFFVGRPVFATTHWSVVLQTGDSESPQSMVALEKLCRAYWFPLYAFIRRKGHSEEDAKDLTQQFFARLLERRDFRTVDARKGKFRTFLLAALTHFLSNERDRVMAAKRGGGRTIISLDEMNAEQFSRFEPASDVSPDKLFDWRWAMTLLAQAVVKLRAEMTEAGKLDVFEELKSFLTNDAPDGEYAKVAQRLGGNNQSVALQVHRMRQRYRELVRGEVAHTVSSPTEVDEEMRHLLAALQG
jgi:DNA-directed RNA polymerase specialized sigma24 family protein